MHIFCGIDPGLRGAVAALDETGQLIFAQDTPIIEVTRGKTPKGNVKTRHLYLPAAMANILADNQVEPPDSILVGIESVHAMPGQGVTSMFSMGRGLGLWEGIVAALRLPVEMIEPMVWKRAMGIPAGSDKRASVELALRLFPSAPIKCTQDGRADAVLLAEFLRRKYTGSMSGTVSGRIPSRATRIDPATGEDVPVDRQTGNDVRKSRNRIRNTT